MKKLIFILLIFVLGLLIGYAQTPTPTPIPIPNGGHAVKVTINSVCPGGEHINVTFNIDNGARVVTRNLNKSDLVNTDVAPEDAMRVLLRQVWLMNDLGSKTNAQRKSTLEAPIYYP